MAEIKEEPKEIMIDPTFNVSTLLTLYSKRQDDLRAAHEKLGEEQIRHVKEVADIRELHTKEIRAGDTVNAKGSAEALALAIQTLNSTTITNANNIRKDLDTTATTMAKDRNDLAQKIADDQRTRDENFNKRIIILEQSSYVGIGKEKVTDPLMDKLVNKMDIVVDRLSEGKGKSGITTPILLLIASLSGGLVVYIIEALLK